MKKGTTKTGFAFTIEDSALNDMELLEALTEVDRGEHGSFPIVIKRLLGDEQKKKLYDHCRDDSGRVPITSIAQEVADIFGSFKESKKS